MSNEPEYNFNESAAAEAAGSSIQLPIALLACTVAVFMFSQVLGIIFSRNNLREGITQLIDNKKQMVELHKSREPVVTQSVDLQKKLQDLVLDVLILAKTDKDAQAIVSKYNIQQNAPAGGEAPAPAPAPAP